MFAFLKPTAYITLEPEYDTNWTHHRHCLDEIKLINTNTSKLNEILFFPWLQNKQMEKLTANKKEKPDYVWEIFAVTIHIQHNS